MTKLSLMTGETMTVQTVKAEVVLNRYIKPVGNSAGVYVPKKFLGKRATVIIYLDEKEKKEGENGGKR